MQRTKELEKDVSDRDEEIEKLSSKKVELEYNLSQRVHHINQIEKTLKDVRAEKVMLTCAGRLPSFLIVLGGSALSMGTAATIASEPPTRSRALQT